MKRSRSPVLLPACAVLVVLVVLCGVDYWQRRPMRLRAERKPWVMDFRAKMERGDTRALASALALQNDKDAPQWQVDATERLVFDFVEFPAAWRMPEEESIRREWLRRHRERALTWARDNLERLVFDEEARVFRIPVTPAGPSTRPTTAPAGDR